jgi:hypothetical protein
MLVDWYAGDEDGGAYAGEEWCDCHCGGEDGWLVVGWG